MSGGAVAKIARAALTRTRSEIDHDAGVAVADGAHRRAEDDALAERGGDPLGDDLGAADDAVLLGAALGVEQRLDRAGRGDVEEGVQEREVARLGRPDGLHREPDQVAPGRRADRPPDPGVEGLRIPAGGVGRRPRRRRRHPLRQPVDPRQRQSGLGEPDRVQLRDRAAVARNRAAALEQVLARGPGREGLDLELAEQGEDPILRRADPLGTELDDLAVADRMVERPPADPLARLEHDHLAPRGGQLACRAEPGEAGADDDHLGLEMVFGGLHRGR